MAEHILPSLAALSLDPTAWFTDIPAEGEREPSLTVDLLRPDDLLALTVHGFNLRLDPRAAPGEPVLRRVDAEADAYLLFAFPPQSLAEAAYYPASTDLGEATPGEPPIDHRVAGPSRLVFALPPEVETVPYSIEGLLDWSRWRPVLPPVAEETAKEPTAPTLLQTALELPYRLLISPGPDAAWRHSGPPVTHAGRAELWHTRLVRRLPPTEPPLPDGEIAPGLEELSPAAPAPLRAVWSPDYTPGNPPPHIYDVSPLGAMHANHRHQIVALTSSHAGYTVRGLLWWFLGRRQTYATAPFHASRLMLSGLGGWLRSRGDWEIDTDDPPVRTVRQPELLNWDDTLSLSQWIHDSTQGRDHFVRLVTEGTVCPTGHRFALFEETERCFVRVPSGGSTGAPGAYLRYRRYVVVREPEKAYPVGAFDHGGREQPFARSLRITTLVSADLDRSARVGTKSFWITSKGQPFRFHMVGRDLADHPIDLSTALIFVPVDETDLDAVAEGYRSRPEWRSSPVPDQPVMYAPGAVGGTTTLTTTAVSFDVKYGDAVQGRFLPTVWQADVRLPEVERITGAAAGTGIRFDDGYLAGGFDAHAGVYARLTAVSGEHLADTALPVGFSADKAGGIATPDLSYTCLSKSLGPLAGSPGDAALGIFDPAAFFAGTARLFGTIALKDLVDGTAGLAANAPVIGTSTTAPPAPPGTVTTLDWSPAVTATPVTAGPLEFVPRGSRMRILVRLPRTEGVAGVAALAPDATVEGRLSSFTLRFAGVIDLALREFAFTAAAGRKPEVTVDFEARDGITFLGDLAFVEQLKDAIPAGVFGEGPSIDLAPDGLRAGFSVALPPVNVAVFSLQQVSLYAGLVLPFMDGKPVFEFRFAERHRPFLVTVAIFGGGGYFGLQVGADGIKQVEAALEFGGAFSLDIGVASGGVVVMAGIYFALTKDAGQSRVVLSGYFRCGGEVSVLGLVSVSVEFHLSLTYAGPPTDKVSGRATLTVAVKVAGFSKSVQLTVERRFGGHGGDPTFRELVTPDAWHTYASAFD